ncbi:lysoplasmalogenase [Nocardioides sp.]|uniref:lysoplasmalogenase n=1 Tax=Nocardioides sp. TaxID=35761 RepID=UPI0035141518
MRRRPVPAAACYLVLAGVDTWLAASPDPRRRRWRRLTKPALMPMLAAATAAATPVGAPGRGAVLAAQAASGAGDVALLGSGERSFLAGVGSFAVAHAAYLRGLGRWGRPWADPAGRRAPVAAAAAWSVLGPAMAGAAARERPALRGPVLGYVAILLSMGASAGRLDPRLPRSARAALGSGAALFLLSDTLIGVREFWVADADPVLDARLDGAVMATYTAGQGLLALGAVRAIR